MLDALAAAYVMDRIPRQTSAHTRTGAKRNCLSVGWRSIVTREITDRSNVVKRLRADALLVRARFTSRVWSLGSTKDRLRQAAMLRSPGGGGFTHGPSSATIGLVARTGLCLVAVVMLCSGCVVNQRAVEQPKTSSAAVLVGTAALPNPMDGLARHPWISLRDGESHQWERWEVMCCPDDGGEMGTVRRSNVGPLVDYGAGGGDVRIHAAYSGEAAERIIACMRENAPRYPYRNQYRAWPGPNSNTFVDYMARECGISVDLPAPSIGKDYRGVVLGVSTTSGGTGVQLETPIIGTKIGLTEGVELHLFGLAWGVDLWPPALIVPVGPGRIGFDDR